MSSVSVDNSASDVRSVDRELLDALRSGDALGINELTKLLGVTATAVRQRIERLLDAGLVEREKVVAGRGRPTFNYRLTLLGHRRAGADHAELADAMWREILLIEDAELREHLLGRIAKRLGHSYRQQLEAQIEEGVASLDTDGNDSLEVRMHVLSQVLSGKRIPADVEVNGELPVIGFKACPHPDLVSESERRAMCQLEEQMLSEALGSQVHLQSCRLDGDGCCQFAPVNASAVNASANSSSHNGEDG